MKKRAQKKIITIILIIFIVIVAAIVIFNIGKPSLKEELEGELAAKKSGKAGNGGGGPSGGSDDIVCDTNKDGKVNSKDKKGYVCDYNNDGSDDYCWICDSDGDGKKDKCWLYNSVIDPLNLADSCGKCEPPCLECEQVCIKKEGSDDYTCEDSGMRKCSYSDLVVSECVPDVEPDLIGGSLDPCNCDPACDPCEQKCIQKIGSDDYICNDTGKHLCNGIGPCVNDIKDCTCDDEETLSGCMCGEECNDGECQDSVGEWEECDDGTCRPMLEVCGEAGCSFVGTCPEDIDCPEGPCEPCIEICHADCAYEGCPYPPGTCQPSGSQRCPDGRCISSDESCSPIV